MEIDLSSTTIYRFPHGFINKRAEPILVTTLTDHRRRQLLEMYLGYRPLAIDRFTSSSASAGADCLHALRLAERLGLQTTVRPRGRPGKTAKRG